MGAVHDSCLIALGLWLFFYRLLLRTKTFGPAAEKITTAACGFALALLAPLLPWPPPHFRALPLALLGVLFAFCHPAFTAMVVALPLGIASGAFMWQLGLCGAVPGMHALLLTLTSLVFIIAFVCTKGLAGVQSLQLFLVPSLSALLITTALADLLPEMGALKPRALLLPSPCAAESGDTQAVFLSFVYWLLVAAVAVALQFMLSFMNAKNAASKKSGPGGDLVQSLLPGAQQEGEEGGFKMPNNEFNDRFQHLVKVVYDKEADISMFDEDEQKMIAICREDEFERDRLIWGGGLI